MNNETTRELLEIVEALNELLVRRGHDETPLEVRAELQNSGKTYNTNKLTNLFLELERDGIAAIGFSLLIDLVNEHCLEGDEK